jgi:hypothetical protein
MLATGRSATEAATLFESARGNRYSIYLRGCLRGWHRTTVRRTSKYPNLLRRDRSGAE